MPMTRLRAIRDDITTAEVDAIVNAANSALAGGGGVDGAIHAAGGPSILAECRRIVAEQGPLPTGRAVITGAGDLPARHVIHTVGPVWGQHTPEEATDLLAGCYRESLDLAAAHQCRTIAFPGISTGVYGFPKPLACETAVRAVREWTAANPGSVDEIVFVCFSEADLGLYQEALGAG